MKAIKQQFHEITRFFRLMIPDGRKHILIAFFAGLTMVFFNLVTANMLKGIYSAVISVNSNLIYKYIILFILLLAGVFIYNCIFWRLYGKSSARITGSLRRIIISKLCSLTLPDMENNHSANTMSILTNDLEAAQGVYVNLRLYVSTLVAALIPTVLVIRASRPLAVLIIFMGFVQLMVNLLVIKPLEKQSSKIREDMAAISSTFVDVLSNNISIRLYCSESFYMNICKDINRRLYKSKMKLNAVNTVTDGINICFGLLGYIIVLTVGGALIGMNRLSIPDLLFITQMRFMMIQGILVFGSYAAQIQSAVVGVNKILTLMEYDIEENV